MSRSWDAVILDEPPEGGLRAFHAWQASTWPQLASSLGRLPDTRVKAVRLPDRVASVQFNPGRVVSSTARVDHAHVSERPCFLCAAHLPAEERGVAVGESLVALCNPFPIGPLHLVVAHREHRPQELRPVLDEVARLAMVEPGFSFFYNGPTSGASAPDHLHLQAMEAGVLPDVAHARRGPMGQVLLDRADVRISLDRRLRTTLMARGRPTAVLAALREGMAAAALVQDLRGEPPLNALLVADGADLIGLLYLRGAHRPRCFHAAGPDRVISSPGAVDMAGWMITVRPQDFDRMDDTLAAEILAETSLAPPASARLEAELKERWHA